MITVMDNINSNILKEFLTNNSSHNLFINSNSSIDIFYLYLIDHYAKKNNIYIKLKDRDIENNYSQDLFNNNPVYIYSNINSKLIDHLINSNEKKIIFVEYKNFKLFNKKYPSLNTYNFKKDLEFFLNQELKITNKLLFEFIYSFPEYSFSEISKFLVHQYKYFTPLQTIENDTIMNLRKSLYNMKRDDKFDLASMFNQIKEEVFIKKFNFLIY